MTCECTSVHRTQTIALTGGPGAGKTAVLDFLRRVFCAHVVVVPEAAGIVYGGGFPRHGDESVRQAAQRAIYYVQREIEAAARSGNPALLLCDRGTLDGVAYWVGEGDFLSAVGTTKEREIARYDMVVHLHTPSGAHYSSDNPTRVESAADAMALDERTLKAWARHPRRVVVASHDDFLVKVHEALALLRAEVPPCCRIQAVSFGTGTVEEAWRP